MTKKEALDLLIEYFADIDDMVYVEMVSVIRKELAETQAAAESKD